MDRPIPEYPLSAFDYDLPEELIAQDPSPVRSEARLLILDRKIGSISHGRFSDLPHFLSAGDMLIFNDTRVRPAKFYGVKETGGQIEFLVLREEKPQHFAVLLKGRVHVGDVIRLVGYETVKGVVAIVREIREGGERLIEIGGIDSKELFTRMGFTPLPPYIRRNWGEEHPGDRERYQTIYAEKPGAVAAPTAGMHFSQQSLSDLAARAIGMARVTLHVGLGTFKPVERDDYQNHPMHLETYEIPEAAKQDIGYCPGIKVAVGTTVIRALETWKRTGQTSGETDLFIYPPQKITCADALITNFHLPKSTLLMLVASFAGLDLVLRAYQEAISREYRFFSYGDAMLIL